MEVGYDDEEVYYIGIATNDKQYLVIGDKVVKQCDKKHEWAFMGNYELIGFYGTNRVRIESLGVISFDKRCIENPVFR